MKENSYTHWCCGKTNKYHVSWLCVCRFRYVFRYPTCSAHTPYCRLRLWPVRLCNIFPHCLIKGKIFEKKYSFNIKYVIYILYRVSKEEWTILRESVPYVKIYRYNPKHLYPELNGYGDNSQRSLKIWQLLHTYWLPNLY